MMDSVRSIPPPGLHTRLRTKVQFRRALENDRLIEIPADIWLAFTAKSDPRSIRSLHDRSWQAATLKLAVLEAFAHPRRFLEITDPLDASYRLVTLCLLEIIFDLTEGKVLLSRARYDEWVEIANHFGLWQLRYLLEDSIFKAFDPSSFALFETVVRQQLKKDVVLIKNITDIVSFALKRTGMRAFRIKNRVKNIAGIFEKVTVKKTSVNEIYDIYGYRVLVGSIADCYKAIEAIHALWPHFPERYKDYILHPKPNGYQSIHTIVRSLGQRVIEFQVRTHEMDVVAGSGPAHHALYKKMSRASRGNAR